jgi:adenine-specific DNA-methyltransferase
VNGYKSLSLTEDHLVLAERRVKHLTPSGQWSGIPRHHFDRARALRQAMSPPEVAMWCGLRGNQTGVKFRKQHPIGPYIADFYNHECGLVVEIDGSQHSGSAEALAYDKDRDAFMENLGLTVLRFSAHEVGADMEGVLASIRHMARQRALASDPAKQWRFAEALRPGEVLFTGVASQPVRIRETASDPCVQEVHDLQVEDACSYVTDLCAVHHYGKGTTSGQ